MKSIHSSLRRTAGIASAIAAAAALAACGTPDPYGANNYPMSPAQPGASYSYSTVPPGYVNTAVVEYGRVTEIALVSNGTAVSGAPAAPSAAGTIAGAVVGGLVGNTIGGGSGRAAATILGAVGGAAIGNHLSQPRGTVAYGGPVYRVTVQTDGGVYRTYDVGSPGDLRPGDRVRIENGMIYLS